MIFTCTRFAGHWPVGSAAVVVAADEMEAAKYLEEALASRGLEQEVCPEWMDVVDSDERGAIILCSGDY